MSKRWPKIWGWNDELLRTDFFSLNILHIVPGGECSYHEHTHNYNLFYIVSGKVLIHTEVGDIELEAGQNFLIHPGTKHQFKGLEDSKVVEFVYVQFDSSDILRSTIGSVKKERSEQN